MARDPHLSPMPHLPRFPRVVDRSAASAREDHTTHCERLQSTRQSRADHEAPLGQSIPGRPYRPFHCPQISIFAQASQNIAAQESEAQGTPNPSRNGPHTHTHTHPSPETGQSRAVLTPKCPTFGQEKARSQGERTGEGGLPSIRGAKLKIRAYTLHRWLSMEFHSTRELTHHG